MKKIVRLTEKDLTKLVKRVMNEGIDMGEDWTSENGDKIYVSCTSTNVDPTTGKPKQPYIEHIATKKKVTLTGDMLKIFCETTA